MEDGLKGFPMIVAPAGQAIITRPAAQEQVVNNTLTNSVYMVQQVGANEWWRIQYHLKLTTANTTPGGKVAITIPSGGTILAFAIVQITWGWSATSGGQIAESLTGALVNGCYIDAMINGGIGGLATLQFAQSTTSAPNPITLQTTSFQIATKYL